MMAHYTRAGMELGVVQSLFYHLRELNNYADFLDRIAKEWKRRAGRSRRAARALMDDPEANELRNLLFEHHDILERCSAQLRHDAHCLITTNRRGRRAGAPYVFSDLVYPDIFEVEDSFTNPNSPYNRLEEIPDLEERIKTARLARQRALRKAKRKTKA